MFDLRELYQEIILDHNKRPRNQGSLAAPTHQAEGYNPLCGDKIKLELQVEDDVVVDLAFDGQGCAISQASGSLMTEALKGRSVEDGRRILADVLALLKGDIDPDAAFSDEALESLAALAGVRDYPARVKCATLAWHAFENALAGEAQPAKTE